MVTKSPATNSRQRLEARNERVRTRVRETLEDIRSVQGGGEEAARVRFYQLCQDGCSRFMVSGFVLKTQPWHHAARLALTRFLDGRLERDTRNKMVRRFNNSHETLSIWEAGIREWERTNPPQQMRLVVGGPVTAEFNVPVVYRVEARSQAEAVETAREFLNQAYEREAMAGNPVLDFIIKEEA